MERRKSYSSSSGEERKQGTFSTRGKRLTVLPATPTKMRHPGHVTSMRIRLLYLLATSFFQFPKPAEELFLRGPVFSSWWLTRHIYPLLSCLYCSLANEDLLSWGPREGVTADMLLGLRFCEEAQTLIG